MSINIVDYNKILFMNAFSVDSLNRMSDTVVLGLHNRAFSSFVGYGSSIHTHHIDHHGRAVAVIVPPTVR